MPYLGYVKAMLRAGLPIRDDYRFSTICSPQLTSYRVDIDGMVKTLVAQLRRKMAHKSAIAPTVIVPGGFVRREST